MKNDILVSICCITYNHEKYISDALRGMINQKTNFKFEILIHDDASTDSTPAIIARFVDEYPSIVKPIYQSVNQFSQGKSVQINNVNRAVGKYIALCEGDDYWIDEYKLQKQVDYLESNPSCTFCFTNAVIQNVADNNKRRLFIPYLNNHISIIGNRKCGLEDVNDWPFIPTATFVFPRDNYKKIPDYWKIQCPTGDLKVRLFSLALGEGYYIDNVTAVYRENVSGSAMSIWKSYSECQVFNKAVKIVNMIDLVDSFSNYSYTNSLRNVKKPHVLSALNNAPSMEAIKTQKSLEYEFNNLPLAKKIKIRFKVICPRPVLHIYSRFKQIVRMLFIKK